MDVYEHDQNVRAGGARKENQSPCPGRGGRDPLRGADLRPHGRRRSRRPRAHWRGGRVAAYDDCAADAFRLRCALDEPAPLLVLETAALGIYANATDTAREYLRSRRPEEPASDAAWDEWVLGNLLRTWWLLLYNDNAKEVLRIVSGLSEEQRNREQAFLEGFQEGQDRALVARHLLALYHWAQATHDIASWRLDGGSEEFASNAMCHLQQAFALATDVELAHLLGWLQGITFRPDVP